MGSGADCGLLTHHGSPWLHSRAGWRDPKCVSPICGGHGWRGLQEPDCGPAWPWERELCTLGVGGSELTMPGGGHTPGRKTGAGLASHSRGRLVPTRCPGHCAQVDEETGRDQRENRCHISRGRESPARWLSPAARPQRAPQLCRPSNCPPSCLPVLPQDETDGPGPAPARNRGGCCRESSAFLLSLRGFQYPLCARPCALVLACLAGVVPVPCPSLPCFEVGPSVPELSLPPSCPQGPPES